MANRRAIGRNTVFAFTLHVRWVFAKDMFAFEGISSYRKLTAQLTLSDQIKRTEKVIGQNICLPFRIHTLTQTPHKRSTKAKENLN